MIVLITDYAEYRTQENIFMW